MTNSVNTRELVLDILMEVLENDGFSHIAIRQMLTKYQYLDKNERAFITRLAEGTIERMITLDFIIDKFSSVKVKKMKPVIRNILRMAVYQIKFMDSVPASAACNEAVKLAVKRGFSQLRGFVNGVLRNIAKNIDVINYPNASKDMVLHLSVAYSMPVWILEEWIHDYGIDDTSRMLKGIYETDNLLSVRCNLSKRTKEDIVKMLQDEGILVKDNSICKDGLLIDKYDSISKVKAFTEGYIQIQDTSSMLVGIIADPKENNKCIDVCAAPGGKTIHIAELLKGTGSVEARDISEYKTDMIEENINRSGATNITTKVYDATVLDETAISTADIVIADLPCSGLGVIGRKTDIKYKTSKQGVCELAELQRKILDVVWQYVKPGGILIFSTCTANKLENDDNMRWFLKEHPFRLSSIDKYLPEELHSTTTSEGYIQILPGINKADGFFIAKMQREL